jgi:nucleotide-binding universal stress UspA family protein
MKKIILPTDFSDNAANAIDYAMHLFKEEKCTFYLLHAYHDAPSIPATKLTVEKDLKQLLQRLEKQNNNPKHGFETVIETESVVNLVNRTAIDNGVDYIFMGTKGYSTLHEVFLGSNTVDVIKYLECACPIVAVPEDYDYDSPEEILFASDFKHRFIAPELVPLVAISKLWDSTVSVVQINTENELSEEQQENKELLKTNLKELMQLSSQSASTVIYM